MGLVGENQKSMYIVRTTKETQLCQGRTLIGVVVVFLTPLATFWVLILKMYLAAHAYLREKKITLIKKKLRNRSGSMSS